MDNHNNMDILNNNNLNIYDNVESENKNYQSEDDEQQMDNNEQGEEDEDDRLTYVLITLDLGNLIHIFEENNISFIDMLLLTKEDLKELQLSLYQRNRIYNFALLFNKYAKNYSIGEISDFFCFNKKFIFNSSIYDRVNLTSQNNFLNESQYNYHEKKDSNTYNYYNNQITNKKKNYHNKSNSEIYSNGRISNHNYDKNFYNQSDNNIIGQNVNDQNQKLNKYINKNQTSINNYYRILR